MYVDTATRKSGPTLMVISILYSIIDVSNQPVTSVMIMVSFSVWKLTSAAGVCKSGRCETSLPLDIDVDRTQYSRIENWPCEYGALSVRYDADVVQSSSGLGGKRL